MAAYNPLSYFSFGKKKEEGASLSTPNTEPETAAAGSTEQGLPGGPEATSTAAPVVHQQAEDAAQQSPAPLLRVVKGNPTDEEVAALTALVYAMQAGASALRLPACLTAASGWVPPLNRGRGHGVGHGLCNSNVPSACIVARALAAV